MGGGWGGREGNRCKGFPCSCFTGTNHNLWYHSPALTIDKEHSRPQIRSPYCYVFITENVYRQYRHIFIFRHIFIWSRIQYIVN